MKHFALLNEDNLVINISVADDNWDSTEIGRAHV